MNGLSKEEATMSEERPLDQTRRQLIQKAIYVSPVVLTLAARLAVAQGGSGNSHESPTLWSTDH
jgi:hypothetical protein